MSLDGKEIGSIDNGEEFTYSTTVIQGDHTLEFSKEGKTKPSTSKTLTINEDTSYSCLLKHDGFSIKINDENIVSYINKTEDPIVTSESSSETIAETQETTTSESETSIATESSESSNIVAVDKETTATTQTTETSETTEASETTETTETAVSTEPTTVSDNITKLAFSSYNDVIIYENGKAFTGTIIATVVDESSFSADDVVLGSDNPEVATIECTSIYPGKIFYSIKPVSIGKAYVYAKTADGKVLTNLVTVYVREYIEADSISIDETCTIDKGVSVSLEYEIDPEDATNKKVTWKSSDPTIVSVDTFGTIKGINCGTAEVTVTTADGCSATCDVTVTISQAQMTLTYKHTGYRGDYIGKDWSYAATLDDEAVKNNGTYTFNVDENIVFYCKATENDTYPDVGDNTVYYTVSEDDLINGFTIEVEVYVTENRGKNAGKQAYVIYTFEFTPA